MLDEDIVHASTFAVHANLNVMLFKYAREALGCQLRTLI